MPLLPLGRPNRRLLDGASLALVVALAAVVNSGESLGIPDRVRDYLTLPLLLVLVALAVRTIRYDLRTSRELKAARRAGRWPLGRGYVVGVGPSDHVAAGALRLEIDERALEFGTFAVDRIPLADVTSVRVRPSWIEIETRTGRTRLAPGSFADRERLLFELAVRCPDAVERGLDELPAPAEPARPVPPAAELVARPAPSGLASALAGPMTPANPAPPRKSGLGVGLFPPPA